MRANKGLIKLHQRCTISVAIGILPAQRGVSPEMPLDSNPFTLYYLWNYVTQYNHYYGPPRSDGYRSQPRQSTSHPIVVPGETEMVS